MLAEFRPHAVFLDAHPWPITHNMTVAARRRGLVIFMHDVADGIWQANLQAGRLPVAGHEYDRGVQWERKVLEQEFGPAIHTGHHATEDYHIDLVRSLYGLAICQPVPI